MVEIGCGLAVRCDVRRIQGTDAVHLHLNYMEKDAKGMPLIEIDGLIVDESTHQPTVYVMECATSPQPNQVEKLLANVEKLKLMGTMPSSPFHHCTTFIPVLGGRKWSSETEDKCKAHNPPIWRVKPSGALYEVRRTFSTCVMKGMRMFVRAVT